MNDITAEFECQKERQENEMTEAVATSTHELRTPLHCIKNSLNLITVNDDSSRKLI